MRPLCMDIAEAEKDEGAGMTPFWQVENGVK